jgi:hypothetical protein
MDFTNIDATTPAGTEKVKALDDSIRQLKTDIETNFACIANYPDTTDIVLGSYATSAIPASVKAKTGAIVYDTTLKKLVKSNGFTMDPITIASDFTASPTTTLAATAITNTAAGNIAATNVQAAINELDTEKAKVAGVNSQVFSVANATAAAHAVALGMLTGVIAANGYITIPVLEGSTVKTIIVQWGKSAGSYDITFPIAFPNACLSLAGMGNTGSSSSNTVDASSVTANGFHYISNSQSGYWIAIGW